MNTTSGQRRFTKRENRQLENKSKKIAIILGLLTLIFIIIIVLWGIPILANLAGFLGELKNPEQPTISEDTIPPVPPRFAAVPEATNSAIVNINGSSEPKSKIDIYLNSELFVTTKADEEGEFHLEKVSLKRGENTLSAFAFDDAENQSNSSEEIKIVFDDMPPDLEIFQPKEEETVYEQKIEIRGKTESEEIRITINEHLTLVEKEGNFTYPFELTEGENKIKIAAEDLAGNKTEKELNVVYHP